MWAIIKAKFKQYGKWLWIALPGILLIAYAIIRSVVMSKNNDKIDAKTNDLKSTITELSNKMQEANTTAVVEIAAAKSKDTAVQADLTRINKIDDTEKRRQELLALRKRVSE